MSMKKYLSKGNRRRWERNSRNKNTLDVEGEETERRAQIQVNQESVGEKTVSNSSEESTVRWGGGENGPGKLAKK